MSHILLVLAGAFLCNAIPHLVSGLRGDPFPTPFASSPGRGDSPPLINVLWGSANLALGALLARRLAYAEVRHGLFAVAIGFVAIGIFLALHFGKVRASSRRGGGDPTV